MTKCLKKISKILPSRGKNKKYFALLHVDINGEKKIFKMPHDIFDILVEKLLDSTQYETYREQILEKKSGSTYGFNLENDLTFKTVVKEGVPKKLIIFWSEVNHLNKWEFKYD